MRNLLILLITLLTLITLTTPLKSGCYAGASYLRGYSYPSYQTTYASYPVQYNYTPPVYNYNYNFVYPAAIPLFSVGYQQPNAVISGAVGYSQQIVTSQSSVQSLLSAAQGQVQATADSALAERLVMALERIAAGGQGGNSMTAMAAEPPHVNFVRQDCASCHTGASAKGGFALFEQSGRYLPPNGEGVGKIIFRLTTKDSKLRMPPNSKMNPEIKDAIIEGLMTSQPAQVPNGQSSANGGATIQRTDPPVPTELPPDPKKKEDGF